MCAPSHRCVSVSRKQFYNQFGIEGGVGWCSLQQSKSQSDCCSYSASRAINFTSLTTGELAAVKDMSWAWVHRESDTLPIFPLSGLHLILRVPLQMSVLNSYSFFLTNWGDIAQEVHTLQVGPGLHEKCWSLGEDFKVYI